MAIRLFHRDRPTLRLPLISKDARFVIWPGVDAWEANLNYVLLEAGEGNVPHVHTLSEDTIFILQGEGTVYDYTNDIALPFHAGCVVHVPVGIKHAVKADRGTNLQAALRDWLARIRVTGSVRVQADIDPYSFL